MQRLKVFIDYQNVYKGARRCYELGLRPARYGQVHPDKVGLLVEALRNTRYKGTPNETRLVEVRIYRGMPDGAMDPKGHGAATRQIEYWERYDDVRAFTHPISYPRGWENVWDRDRITAEGEKPREKGIDVQLAVDLVLGAVDDEYDVGVVFSADQDLLPAIRAAMRLGKHIEVAAWRSLTHAPRRIPGLDLPPYLDGSPRRLWCHHFNEEDFRFARDDTDYTRPL